jgi:hypothetical protein
MGVQHAYRYLRSSSLSADLGLKFASSGGTTSGDGPTNHPHFFRGFLEHADQAARCLLAVGEVARTRYFDPSANAQMRDPVVTCHQSMIRFESFSACNGVYARFDIDSEGLDAEWIRWGTTNVDFNEPLRSALAKVGSRDPLRLSIGSEELEVATVDAAITEKKVPLPGRWLKGFAEVQIALAAMTPIGDFDESIARSAIRDLSIKRTGNQPMWVAFSRSGARLTQTPGPNTPCLVGPHRLAALRQLQPFIRGLTVYSAPSNQNSMFGCVDAATLRPSAWVVHLRNARLTLVISPEIYRGFSGEGAVLDAMTNTSDLAVAQVGEHLEGQSCLDATRLSAAINASKSSVLDAFHVLGASGRLGFDPHTSGFFHRDLPFDRTSLDVMQPRLANARELVASGAVALDGDVAVVTSGEARYVVNFTEAGATCTCLWFANHREERGPCKHSLAAQLALRSSRSNR